MINKYIKFNLIITGLLGINLLGLTQVSAADINISVPAKDEEVVLKNTGELYINYEISNTHNASFNYEVKLRDAVCYKEFKTIATVNNRFAKPGNYKQILKLNELEQGTYCINVCVYDLDEIECNNRTFILTNQELISTTDEGDDTDNKPPVILTTPSRLKLNYRENFFYQIKAQDPNGDAYTYRLISAPDFIYLDQKAGTITNTLIMRPGSYFVAFVVIDRNGAYTQQNFTINIFEKYDGNGNVISPYPTEPLPSPSNVSSAFDIIKPKSGELLSGTNNDIKWVVKGIVYDKSELYYQKIDGTKTLILSVDQSKTEYEWNVTDLTNGEYKLQIELKKNNQLIQVREVNNLVISNNVNSSSLLILNLKPANQSQTSNTRPEISVNLVPSEGGKIDFAKSEIKLDNKNITKQCSLNENEIKCFPEKDLDKKEHTVKFKIVDSNGQEAQQQWSFSVVEKEPDPTPNLTLTPQPSGNGNNLPTPTPAPTDNPISKIIEQLREFLFNLGRTTWLVCCGLLFAVVGGIVGLRFLRGRNSVPYSTSKSTSSTNKVTGGVTPSTGENSDNLEDFTDYSVGDYTVGEEYEPIMPSTNNTQSESTVVTNTNSIDTPVFGDKSDIMPDWLKGDADDSSKPITSDGEILDDNYNNSNISEGSQVHDDFGLADDQNVEEEKSKNN